MAETTITQQKQGGNPGPQPREMLYTEAAKHAPRAIEILVELMESGDNDNVRVAAAKCILAKAIPDLKALEVSGKEGGELLIKLDAGNIVQPASKVSTETA